MAWCKAACTLIYAVNLLNLLLPVPFFGQGIGGLLGADKAEMHEVMAYCMDRVHRGRPTHFLGLGGVDDIWNGVALGADTFDCVTPTRIARHGWAMVRWDKNYKLNLRNARFREDSEPLDDECDCSVCQTYSRAYIHHLLKAKEMQGLHLLTVHNMRFMMRLLESIRGAIADDRFATERALWCAEGRLRDE